MKADAVVIGGGASGLLLAATAAQRGLKIILLEPNDKLGRKLRLTGKGRCNITNDCDVAEVISNITSNKKFVKTALYNFSPADTISFFSSIGVKMKTERGNRVFPLSDSADEVADKLASFAKSNGVIVSKAKAESVLTDNGEVTAVLTNKGKIECRACAVCTGGLSYPGTGSNGDGHKIASMLGHKITACRPSLVALVSNDSFCSDMQGLSLKNINLSAFEDGKLVYSDFGEMLFTHFGVSGPLVLSASAHMQSFEKSKYELVLDLKPALSEKKLDIRVLRDFEKYKNSAFKNALSDLVPKSMVSAIITQTGIPSDTAVNSITKQQRKALVQTLKAFRINIVGALNMESAIITSGGVDTSEIDPRTMQSKLVKGLFFAGEILDVDAYTGGYNLQIAWSTARMAGNNLCKEEK